MDIILHPIGWVHSAENGPREDYWGDVVSEIHLASHFSPDTLVGLEEFSHIEVLFHLHGVDESAIVQGSRHPRGNPQWPRCGIFAQRAKARPNRIAATICELLSVEGLTLQIRGLDALNGSPVLDIKPVFAEFLPHQTSLRQPEWSHQMMANYFASGKP
ncbi:MAG: SAM-dependent methyltransferase [Acidobacteriia bacterium]|nr:SAM-dependent methyltransferase [Terriglobia bacterium]